MTVERDDAQDSLIRFLEECAASSPAENWPRVFCPTCNASRSMYCFECYRVFIPQNQWPQCLTNDGSGIGPRFALPFKVDLILDDRKAAATGVQVAAMLRSAGIVDKCGFRIFDSQEKGSVPSYKRNEGTFLLFPDSDSQPLSVVAASGLIQRLILLDCKWSNCNSRLHPSISVLPRIHLDGHPKGSYYWRWHNSGDGMLSTVEALYFAAWQVATQLGWRKSKCEDLVALLWLFGLQREVIRKRYAIHAGISYPPHLPFSEAGKQYHRELRKNQPLRGIDMEVDERSESNNA